MSKRLALSFTGGLTYITGIPLLIIDAACQQVKYDCVA